MSIDPGEHNSDSEDAYRLMRMLSRYAEEGDGYPDDQDVGGRRITLVKDTSYYMKERRGRANSDGGAWGSGVFVGV